MPNKLRVYAGRRKHLIAIVGAIAIVIGLFVIKYQQYAYALSWHCFHGNSAQIGGHRVTLPIWWWKEDSHAYDTALLVRASVTHTYLRPTIVVSPAFPGAIRDTNQEELQAAQAAISEKHKTAAGTLSSLVIINTKAFTMYCEREDFTTYGVDLSSNLFCTIAKVQYAFTYNGPPDREKEAQSIFSSLE